MTIKVIGLGGIGSHLIGPLCRYLEAASNGVSKDRHYVTLIDGDSYEAKNADRQEFQDIGNKSETTASRLKLTCRSLVFEAKPHYVTDGNIFLFVNEGDFVFLCVDNHDTRLLFSEHCKTLQNVVLISGGNEYTDGNVQIYIRKNGQDLTPPLTYLHLEIEHPKDRNPAEMSCEELAQAGVPQLIFTNFTAAALMLSSFWMLLGSLAEKTGVKYTEQCFDLTTGMVRSYYQQQPEAPKKKKKER